MTNLNSQIIHYLFSSSSRINMSKISISSPIEFQGGGSAPRPRTQTLRPQIERFWALFNYRPQTSLGQGNIFTNMCQEFCQRGAGSASVHAGIPPPGTRHPPNPPGTRHPPEQSMLGDMVNQWAVCILLECILVFLYFFHLTLLCILFL